jgi:pimeloyl-ACP methyl ester carboxylesterase
LTYAASHEPLRDFPQTERSPWHVISREVGAFAAAALLFPFGWRRQQRPTTRRETQRTIVMVHGYMGNRSALLPLRAFLRAFRNTRVLYFDYDSKLGIEAAAVSLKAFLRRHVRGGRIDLVCHSLGGVIAQVYLQELGGARRVDRCITLGTPWLGTYNAYWVLSRVGRELRPDSALLARLRRSRAAASRVRFTSIVAGSDNIVIPRVHAALVDDVVHVPEVGHLGLLYSPTVFRTVADRLSDRALA